MILLSFKMSKYQNGKKMDYQDQKYNILFLGELKVN